MHTDEALMGRARAGDAQAFRMLVERHKGRVGAVARGMLGRGPDAEDAAQETFIRFFRSLGEFRGEAALATYLTRIAVNQCLNVLHKRKAMGPLLDVEAARAELGRLGSVEAEQRADAREVVHRALGMLAPEFRAVAVLRLLEGYSTRETAEILGVAEGTVLSRLSRAQEKLKALLLAGSTDAAANERES